VYIDVTAMVDRELHSRQQQQQQQTDTGDDGGDTTAAGDSTAGERRGAHATAAATSSEQGAGPAAAFAWGSVVMGGAALDPGSEFDRRLAAGAGVACRLRGAVHSELGFTCSAGISNNKLLAKIGSAMHKVRRPPGRDGTGQPRDV
jgi:nucleotidyltransferase/DNA polymerase involved in DNA repair